jgi:asparagine synthase (glutamine-hydrolysing)
MCAIAGIVSASADTDVSKLRRCGEVMAHRGPDAQGTLERGRASLVFRRLAIIDLSPDGNQPMTNESGDVWVVFNGEIYNFAELRRELEPNHHFRSRTDTEVLIHGYEQWGFDGLLQRIDGMFAFAIWDERKEELFLARDRVGKKPLYYAHLPNGIAFASTLNAMLELLPSRPEIDPVALDEYLVYQAVPAPRTIYAGVRMLPPAHRGHWREGKPLEVKRYWHLSYSSKSARKETDLLDELDHLVRDAVKRRLISDVPLGAFLSGGVDSSLIVGVMSALGAGPVEAVHVGFDDPAYDERPYAREVAAKWGARLHEHVMDPGEIMRLPEIVWHYGQPLADVSIVPTYAVARAAREHVTVVLNGDGGDEAFAGYARPIVARAAQTFRTIVPQPLRGVGTRVVSRAGKKGRMLATAASVSSREAFTYDRGLRGVRGEVYSPEFLDRLHHSDPDRHYRDVWDAAEGPTDVDRALSGDFTTYLPDQLLVKMDVSTMAHSVEARSPLLDTRLLEFAARIPSTQLTRGFQTKYLLKRLAARYVPSHLLYRRKRGFVMPASKWLRGELSGLARNVLTSKVATQRGLFRSSRLRQMLDEHLAGTSDWGGVLWTALVLEIWHLLFVDRSLSRSDSLSILA